MSETLQEQIVHNLLTNEDYSRQVLPFLKKEYFTGPYRFAYEATLAFVEKYNSLPTVTALRVEADAADLNEESAVEVSTMLNQLDSTQPATVENKWLLDNTEAWCKDRAVYLAVMDSIAIIQDKNKNRGEISGLLEKALSVSFDSSVGHDYLADAEARYDYYNRVEDRIPFSLEKFNEITNGGVPRKTLTIILAGCVHPSTPVHIQLDDEPSHFTAIGDVKQYLERGRKVMVDSPDGWVKVDQFVEKGQEEEYVCTVDGRESVRCSGGHKFETSIGWFTAEELWKFEETGVKLHVYCSDKKFREINVTRNAGKFIDIVDITVDHPNHRYWTGGLSSHNTGVGKSLFMCHLAATSLEAGRNVLYITMEMAEEKIAERIDANLMNVDIGDVSSLPKDTFKTKVQRIAARNVGQLIIKEYPTASAHVGHFRGLLNELRLKKKFIPDVIFIDYLNICASSRMRGVSEGVNSYTFIKAIAEEIRGLAVEYDVPIFSATQVTRSGFNNSDVELTDTSESFGLPATADLMFALIATEELSKLGQIMVKQLKNRYNDLDRPRRFVIGVDKAKMKLYDVEDTAQSGISKEKPKPPTTAPPSFPPPQLVSGGKLSIADLNKLKV